MKKNLFIIVVLTTCFLIGCNGNAKIEGHVTFEDGSPLKKGTVIFDSGTHMAKGELDSAGLYQLGSLKAGDGIPVGTYKVYITGAMEGGRLNARGGVAELPQALIDTQYAKPETSGLTCEVTGSTTFDITVKPPAKR